MNNLINSDMHKETANTQLLASREALGHKKEPRHLLGVVEVFYYFVENAGDRRDIMMPSGRKGGATLQRRQQSEAGNEIGLTR